MEELEALFLEYKFDKTNGPPILEIFVDVDVPVEEDGIPLREILALDKLRLQSARKHKCGYIRFLLKLLNIVIK